MSQQERQLLSGNEAVALGALHGGVTLGTGYPGTPSTEILESFSAIGGNAQWAPNEKVALEVATGVTFAGARTLVTMKHVGVNVAADPLFTLAYTGTNGGLVLISADDPGMASSQNEQDNRYYARAAGVAMLEPADSQEAYDFTRLALQLSEQFALPVILRLTTRICHSKTVVQPSAERIEPKRDLAYQRDITGRVMIPAYARSAHHRMRQRLEDFAAWNDKDGPNTIRRGDGTLGIITAGVAYVHTAEAAPQADILKLGATWPLPMKTIEDFVASHDRVMVVDEGENVLARDLQAAGLDVEGKPAMYRYGELNVERVDRILRDDTTEEPPPPKGKPPQLCQGCPHRKVFQALSDRGCLVAGDIGCYTLGVLPPFESIDTCVCMGASIGTGLGLRHVLADADARKVVSVIGDSTFMHSGITGLVEMAYNPPPSGHVVIVLDNNTTAMTGLQEHPGTGRSLDHGPARQVPIEALAEACQVDHVHVIDPAEDFDGFCKLLDEALGNGKLNVIIARRPCILSIVRDRKLQEVTNG